jgi:hypothetical protein
VHNDKKSSFPNECALHEGWVEEWDRWFAPQWAVYSAEVGRKVTFEGFIERKKVFAGNPKLVAIANKIIADYSKEA